MSAVAISLGVEYNFLLFLMVRGTFSAHDCGLNSGVGGEQRSQKWPLETIYHVDILGWKYKIYFLPLPPPPILDNSFVGMKRFFRILKSCRCCRHCWPMLMMRLLQFFFFFSLVCFIAHRENSFIHCLDRWSATQTINKIKMMQTIEDVFYCKNK